MSKNKLPVILEPEEAQNLLKQPSKRYPTGLRNKTIMSLMLHCGLRLSEVTNLRPGNINLTKGKLRVESGKGKKDRDLAIPDYLTDLLDTWRSIRPKSNYFFSTLKGRKLSDRYIQQMVKRYALKAGIEKKISPHTLRHYLRYSILQADKRYGDTKADPGPFRHQHNYYLHHPGKYRCRKWYEEF